MSSARCSTTFGTLVARECSVLSNLARRSSLMMFLSIRAPITKRTLQISGYHLKANKSVTISEKYFTIYDISHVQQGISKLVFNI
jgi:hypothetical protein